MSGYGVGHIVIVFLVGTIGGIMLGFKLGKNTTIEYLTKHVNENKKGVN